jgi:hypothetical protein
VNGVWGLCRHDDASFTFVSYDAVKIDRVMQHRKLYGLDPMVCLYQSPSFDIMLTVILLVRFESLTAMCIKITVFWDVACSLVGGLLRNVGTHLPKYMASVPRRSHS